MEKSSIVIYEIDMTKKYIVSCPGSMANAVRVHEQLTKWLASDIPFLVLAEDVRLERVMEASDVKYRELKPGELMINNSIVTDIDAAMRYLLELKETLRIPNCDWDAVDNAEAFLDTLDCDVNIDIVEKPCCDTADACCDQGECTESS